MDILGIKKLKKELKLAQQELKEIKLYVERSQLLLTLDISDIIKQQFSEVSQAYDKLILKESEDIRKEWKQFEKQNPKLFKYKKNK